LAAGVEAQLPVKRGDLRVQRLGHRYRDGDLLTRSIGQLDPLKPGATFTAEQVQLATVGQPMVVEHRADALLPLTALIDQRVTQADLRAQIEQMLGRDPGLR